MSRSPANSAYSEQAEKGFGALRFADDGIEKEFRIANRLAGLRQLRIALWLGIAFGISLPGIDFFLNGFGFSENFSLARAAITPALLICMLAASYSERRRNFLSPLGVVVGLSMGTALVLVNALTQRYVIGPSATGFILVTFYTYFFLGLRFWPAFLTSTSLLVTYLIVGIMGAPNPSQLSYQILFLAFSNIVAATGLYNLEYSRRFAFLKERELEYLASRDGLTGLANRKAFDDQLASVWKHCQREELPLAVALIDVDHFKIYNDVYGHQRGDRCLTAIAQPIGKLAKRPLDLAARYGGEEFAVLLPGCDAREAYAMLDDLRSRIFELNLQHSDSPTASVVTVSIGIASISPHATARSAAGLLQSADSALYKAKSAGRNKVVIARDEAIDAMKTGVFNLDDNSRELVTS